VLRVIPAWVPGKLRLAHALLKPSLADLSKQIKVEGNQDLRVPCGGR
jgi:hypothetical protein